ncbi:MAG: enoyl-CoA hydratase-related protein [Xanthomonadales bacterium]|nr:enoyl-CoA hydratase-related protein [Xanthomonadales bacterium]
MSKFESCDTLELELDRDWLTVWLNRPKARNALSGKMIAELHHVFSCLKDNCNIRGVSMRGRGGIFCSGGDLKGFKTVLQGGGQSLEDIARISRQNGMLFDLINEAPQVVVMLVEGAAMAGGLGILCCGDVVVVTQDAKFAMTETSIGIPPAQIAPFVVERLGLKTARRLMLTASRFTGEKALHMGLADHLAADAAHMELIEAEIKKQVRQCAPKANAVTKQIVLATRHADRASMIELAGTSFAQCMLSEEGHEGIAAFFEKRKPIWAVSSSNKQV